MSERRNQRGEVRCFTPLLKKLVIQCLKRFQDELKVFIANRESTCAECGKNLGRHAWITLNREKGALCLACADLDHLVFLPAGDAALTRRARKHSVLSAVVLQWSRARKRYERQGLLMEAAALEKAEEECLADAEIRTRRQERAAGRRAELDQEYLNRFAARVTEVFPGCPAGREREIAAHACQKYSGRVGRSAAAKEPGRRSGASRGDRASPAPGDGIRQTARGGVRQARSAGGCKG